MKRLILSAFLCVPGGFSQAAGRHSNFIFIVADDLGRTDVAFTSTKEIC